MASKHNSVYAIYNRSKWVLGYLGSLIVIGTALGFFFLTFPGSGCEFRVQ